MFHALVYGGTNPDGATNGQGDIPNWTGFECAHIQIYANEFWHGESLEDRPRDRGVNEFG
jgi:hypothetical protein